MPESPQSPYIVRNRKVTSNEMNNGEFIVNEYNGELKGYLKMNGRLFSTPFGSESIATEDKSQNEIIINDGVNNRVIIGDISPAHDGSQYGIKVSQSGYDANTADMANLVLNSDLSSNGIEHAIVTTIGNTATVIWSKTLDDESSISISAIVSAKQDTTAKRNGFYLFGVGYRNGSTAVLEGQTEIAKHESDGAYNAAFAATSNDIALKVTGIGTGGSAETHHWKAAIQYVIV